MAWPFDNQVDSVLPIDYGVQTLANYTNNAMGNNQNNSGLQWWMNADRSRYPSPMMPDNLTQDLGASTVQLPNQGGVDVDNNLQIIPNVPRPGKGFGFIPSALMDIGRRIGGNPYFSEKFPSRTFTEGDRTYSQSGLGGYFSPDEVFNMQEFGGVGPGDPRVDQFGKNIVSMAGDYEEGIEDWVRKYGQRQSTNKAFLKRRADKIAMLNKIRARDAQIAADNQAASNQLLRSQGITHSGAGGGGSYVDPGGRNRGGQGAFRENVAQMRGAARSYTDAQGNVGYSTGRKDGGRIGYQDGLFVDEDVNIQGLASIV